MSNPLLPTAYSSLNNLFTQIKSQNSDGSLTFNNTSAAAEYNAWVKFSKNTPTGTIPNFDTFLASENNFMSGDFVIPATPMVVNKLIVYGVGAVFLFVLLK